MFSFCVFFVQGLVFFCFCLLLRFCYTHLSGHGSQSTDYDGDEVDGSDETICPVDYKVLIQGAFCVTQLKLYTLDKLSTTIFCCLSVCEASVTPDQISTFPNIYRHTSTLLTQYNLILSTVSNTELY